MRFFGVITFGLLAVVTMLFVMVWPWLSPFLMIASVPFWLLFVIYLARSLKH